MGGKKQWTVRDLQLHRAVNKSLEKKKKKGFRTRISHFPSGRKHGKNLPHTQDPKWTKTRWLLDHPGAGQSSKPPQDLKPHNFHFRQIKFISNIHSHTSAPVQESYSLNTHNTIYIITCTLCNKQYIGETKHTIETRLKQHLYNIKRAHLQTELITHFQEHPITHLTISGLQSHIGWTCGPLDLWAAREWIQNLQTITPNGLY